MEVITADELTGVQRTWKLVAADQDKHGKAILQALFTTYPEYRTFFKNFKEKKTEDLPKDGRFVKHAKNFMTELGSLVNNLEDEKVLVKMLHENARRHHARKVTTEHYKNTLALLPGYLKAQLGSHLDDTAASGWGKVLNNIKVIIDARLKELQNNPKK